MYTALPSLQSRWNSTINANNFGNHSKIVPGVMLVANPVAASMARMGRSAILRGRDQELAWLCCSSCKSVNYLTCQQ